MGIDVFATLTDLVLVVCQIMRNCWEILEDAIIATAYALDEAIVVWHGVGSRGT
jgi:hypothetical protein